MVMAVAVGRWVRSRSQEGVGSTRREDREFCFQAERCIRGGEGKIKGRGTWAGHDWRCEGRWMVLESSRKSVNKKKKNLLKNRRG